LVTVIVAMACAAAQASEPPRIVIPFHGDPRVRVERPETPPPRTLRIVTDDEFPPLHFADPDGQPTGFSVELMRAICALRAIACSIQVRRFDLLLPALTSGEADVVAAAIPVTAELKARFPVSRVYHRLPARFLGRLNDAGGAAVSRLESGLSGVRVAVVRDTAHAGFLGERFPAAQALSQPDLVSAIAAVQRGDADLLFGDGQTLALRLAARPDGLGFVGGPYLDAAFFGEGIGFVLARDDGQLRRHIDHALQTLWEDGTYARLFLRAFSVSPF
jgi:polar amino acid transport system substrate-binding protein